ncbi:lysophospholipid acyltransferase family protein [Mycoplasmopsis felis]|uniref:Phospholipid/glycerol acyltransferase domain-containing protein n=1 Tax=Mycoplasmopsis felis TaxID=33923 RepID=A0A809RVB1_9BACT|nr:lysophospholipid acyltransferase family protein [Mycoplasmopsis felis]WQQ05729.1 lysophospholipid acyltransferase family protein [Mycoplasmopsis felis]WQQ07313.1 lysophospholipid acyltransferase family protein [Mycoplasmopsis felis]WQQ07385.1 lysophospholipid acyltransferase family protein [Mycoplasmopsis felis]WQQ08361.1 lysophospholipid acyltransferase family protein [Mycoplasmopsis felis]WQQ10355.1 lysophospholipid acyltransferase family protein [Mycoplasmopsis felis]
MKKFFIDSRIKLLFTFPIWIIRFIKINSLNRKYRKTPELITKEQRYKYILKLSKKILNLYNIDLTVNGLENLPNKGGVILTPNHKSYLDALAMIVALEQTNQEFIDNFRIPTFVGKKELKKQKTIYKAMNLIDSFFIDRGSIKDSLNTMKDFSEFIKINKTYGVVFPEGTRIKQEELGEFSSGVFKFAINSYVDIIPVSIKNTLDSYSLKRKSRKEVIVSFLQPHKAKNNITKDPNAISNQIKQQITKDLGING